MTNDPKTNTLTLTNDDLNEFRQIYGLDGFPNAYFCSDFLARLLVGRLARRLEIEEIVFAIRDIETGSNSTHAKPAAEFRGPHLKGLWHKHFFQPGYLLQNILNEQLHDGYLDGLIHEFFKQHAGQNCDEIDPGWLIYQANIGAYEKRNKEDRITGEWLIFVPFQGTNYYLTLATHNEKDSHLRERILKTCTAELPFLAGLLTGGTEQMAGNSIMLK